MSGSVPAWLRAAPDSQLAGALRRGRPAWSEFVHLLWSVWVFIVPVFTSQGYDARWWLLTLASYPLFVVLFTAALLLPARRVRACALGMVALALALMPWYPSGMSYFVFGCVFLGAGRWRTPWGYPLALLALNVLFLACARVIGYPWSAMLWMPITTLAIGTILQVQRLVERKDAVLLLSQEEVRRLAATAERERIGRDLHDILGHSLTTIAVKADLAQRLVSRDPAAAEAEIGDLARVTRQALADVRATASGMREVRLATEIASARSVLSAAGLACEAPTALPPLDDAASELFGYVVREAVTNVVRHAGATTCRIDTGERTVSVADDGRGLGLRERSGSGLAGLRARLSDAGGVLEVESGPGGTTVRASLPEGES